MTTVYCEVKQDEGRAEVEQDGELPEVEQDGELPEVEQDPNNSEVEKDVGLSEMKDEGLLEKDEPPSEEHKDGPCIVKYSYPSVSGRREVGLFDALGEGPPGWCYKSLLL
ncbi:hypothetical protein D9758_003432 [Tetrapyrgos nigripes]|uniref:Uncharacterized protein n=1 Tax=Tetrapyrgos nigripes TaxID=182062 RepID=A0A8H5GV45_9AGAR|nr:hypothetical protein D9758_003432 [Tetrapyrgos nigripes]